jgi:hypothetical protein
MRYEIRPLGPWIGPVTDYRKTGQQFRASWDATLKLLRDEAELLDATTLVVQVDANPDDIRRDGMLRVRARVGFPGVKVSLDSRFGPLTYATDAYETWQANVRAVALSMQALRAVDRYGVSKSGEQYRGWSAIEGGPAQTMSRAEAARLLAAGTDGRFTAEQLFADRACVALAYKLAIRTLHPDVGGDPEMFRRVTSARDLLDKN